MTKTNKQGSASPPPIGPVGQPHPVTGMLPLQPNPYYRKVAPVRSSAAPAPSGEMYAPLRTTMTTRLVPAPKRSKRQPNAPHAAQHRIHEEMIWTWRAGKQKRYFPQYCVGSRDPDRCPEWHYYSDGATGRACFTEYADAEDFFRAKGVGWS